MFGIAANSLPRASRSFHYRIDRFEMTRICRETNFNLRAGREFSDRAITEMIFYIAIAGDGFGNVVLAELGEDDAERFFQKVREHIQAAAMRHSHADFLHAHRRTFMKKAIEDH